MRVIGIELTASELKWVLLDGQRKQGSLEYMESNKLPFPKIGKTFTENLVALKSQVLLVMKSLQPQCIAIIKAQNGGLYSSSVERIKMEGVLELAALELDIQCCLVSGKTVDDAEKKKFFTTTSTTIEQAFCDGKAIAPKYLRRAAFAAWTCLP